MAILKMMTTKKPHPNRRELAPSLLLLRKKMKILAKKNDSRLALILLMIWRLKMLLLFFAYLKCVLSE
jgi:hypothetical protein